MDGDVSKSEGKSGTEHQEHQQQKSLSEGKFH